MSEPSERSSVQAGSAILAAAGRPTPGAWSEAERPARDVVSLLRLGARKGLRRAVGARAWYERGLRAEASYEYDQACAAYERALAANPELGDAACNLGRLLHERGDLVAAEAWYRLALCADRDVAVYWFNLGVALEDQSRRAEAIACYRTALDLDDRLADAHFNIARLYEHAGDAESARAAFRHLQSYRAHGA
jgi:tetratricopeptide (TPR) repeat protein